MREVWVRGNRRAILFGCILPIVLLIVGGALLLRRTAEVASISAIFGGALVGGGAIILAIMINELRRPRIAYSRGQVLFYVRRGAPAEVPVEIVEGFLIGQGPAELPVMSQQPKAMNLVVRLSQRHTEWAEQPVKAAIAKWCGGYVTLRGAWCEPLDNEVVRRLNRRLKEVKDQTSNG